MCVCVCECLKACGRQFPVIKRRRERSPSFGGFFKLLRKVTNYEAWPHLHQRFSCVPTNREAQGHLTIFRQFLFFSFSPG